MKTLKTLVVLVALIAGSQLVQAKDKTCSCIEVLSIKRDIFYFKTPEDLTGATIEVYSADTLIFTNQVAHRKTLIDFYFEKPGVYTIKIIKGAKVEEFTYQKQSPSPYAESESGHHIEIAK
ncbi:hypothetical protein [Chryseolinea serpens]|nr:hypothetical protein [Chryseolinea serpens]